MMLSSTSTELSDGMATRPAKLSYLWDLCCLCSIVGIWPRFIEPKLLMSNMVTLKIKGFPKELSGLRILHFSDLHLHPGVSDRFLAKICAKAALCAPDIVAFTGDFLCRGALLEPERLRSFLNAFPQGRYGNFAVVGNHDYDPPVTLSPEGIYQIQRQSRSHLRQATKILLGRSKTPCGMALEVQKPQIHKGLLQILADSPFQLLHNETRQVQAGEGAINLCGLGEYSAGRCDPLSAFSSYDTSLPGLILTHHPDSVSLLNGYPGHVILAGHTHGPQVNLPLLGKKLSPMEHSQYRKGMVRLTDKWLYVTRGVGSLFPFRFFSPPELLCLTLNSSV